MSISTLTVVAKEDGTYIITAAFTDEDGNAVAPATLNWSLTDLEGAVINEREEKEVANPSATETFVLSGDDIQVLSTEYGGTVTREFTVEGTYNSDLGSGLPIKDSVRFTIDELVAVT